MKYLLMVLVLGIVAMIPMEASVKAAERDFHVIPANIVIDIREDGYGFLRQVEISNIGDTDIVCNLTMTRYRDFHPDEIAMGKMYGNLTWVSIEPSELEIFKGSHGIANIRIEIPEELKLGHYVMHIEIKDPSGVQYIPIVVRIGESIPTHSYGISPAFYELLAKDFNEFGERFSDTLCINVTNTGTAQDRYRIYSRYPDDPGRIDSTYSIGELHWIEIIDSDWNIVDAGEEKSLRFRVVLPSSVDDGKYKIWVGAQAEGSNEPVKIEYASKLLINVTTTEESLLDRIQWWAYPLMAVTLIVLLIGGYFGCRRLVGSRCEESY